MDELVAAGQDRCREHQIGLQLPFGDSIIDALRRQEIAVVLQVFISFGEDALVAAHPDGCAAAVREEDGGHLLGFGILQVGDLEFVLCQRSPFARAAVITQLQKLVRAVEVLEKQVDHVAVRPFGLDGRPGRGKNIRTRDPDVYAESVAIPRHRNSGAGEGDKRRQSAKNQFSFHFCVSKPGNTSSARRPAANPPGRPGPGPLPLRLPALRNHPGPRRAVPRRAY